uniref:Uncharacterized protein n=1 Tax=Tetranychus urticae TaxID=32264 RepID=T1KW48_TETUR
MDKSNLNESMLIGDSVGAVNEPVINFEVATSNIRNYTPDEENIKECDRIASLENRLRIVCRRRYQGIRDSMKPNEYDQVTIEHDNHSCINQAQQSSNPVSNCQL